MLYVYEVITRCMKFNGGGKVLRTYTKMHDARTKDKRCEIACANHVPPHDIVLKLIEEQAR